MENQWLTWYRTGTLPLNEHLFKIKKIESPLCSCNKENENINHFINNCSKYSDIRSNILNNQYQDLFILLNSNEEILNLMKFIKLTKRFKN